MADTITAAAPVAAPVRPYPPSWVDRTNDWIGRLPVPPLVTYAGLALVLVALETAVKFADGTYRIIPGGYPAGFQPWHVVLAITGVYFLAMMQWLDSAAARALAAFRPAMTVDDATFARLAYEVATLPARPTLVFSAVWTGWAVVLLILVEGSPTLKGAVAMFTSPAADVVETALSLFVWWVGGALIFHTLHQLRLVRHILTYHTHIDLFAQQPLYAFSGLSAVSGGGLVLTAYAWVSAVPGLLTSALAPLAFLLIAIPVLLGTSTFVWPVWGVHRLLVTEKAHWLAGLSERKRAAILDLQQRLDAGDRAEGAHAKDTLEALGVAEATLDKIPTWPWQPGTARGLAGALLLPVALYVINRLLEHLVAF